MNRKIGFFGLLGAVLWMLMIQPAFAQLESRSGWTGDLPSELFRSSSLPSEVACAGVTIVEEGFENGIPTGWVIVDGDGLTPRTELGLQSGWQLRSDYKDSSNTVMVSPSWYVGGGTSNDWLISPAISLGSNPCFSWKTYSQDAFFPEAYEVRISTAGQDTADFLANALVDTVLSEAGGRTIHAIDLQDFAGQTVFLAFRQTSQDQFVLALDDVRISQIEPLDIGVSAIADVVASPGDTLEFDLSVANYGSETVNSFTVCWSIDGGSSNCIVVDSVSIPPNQAITFTHDSLYFSDTTNSFYDLCAWTSAPNGAGDNDINNDTTCSQIEVGTPVGIQPEVQELASLTVYPNPGSGVVTVSVPNLKGSHNLQLSIVDVQGRLLRSSHWSRVSGSFSTQLNLDSLPSGLYLLELHSDRGERVVKRLMVD